MDKNKDGKITMEEFVASGDSALPNFEALGAEGHHYDVESGTSSNLSSYVVMFLADSWDCQNSSSITKVGYVQRQFAFGNSAVYLFSAEMYHNTPETQTDEAYNHPEDIEHFAQHEQIERDEAEREAKFQGITVDEALAQHDHFEPIPGDAAPGDAAHADDSDKVAQPVEGGAGDEHVANPYFHDDAAVAADVHPHDDQMHAQQPIQNPPQPSNPKVNRVTPPEKQDPSTRYKDAKRESEVHDDWGTGSGGYKVPKSPSERMRCVYMSYMSKCGILLI